MKQLDRLLFEQGGECFFCRKSLPKAEASIEHLVASANGGPNHEDNCVVCCRTLNALLGSKPLKQKIQVVLNQKGAFRCPADSLPSEQAPAPRPGVAAQAAKAGPENRVPAQSGPTKPMFTLAAPNQPARVAQVTHVQTRTVTCATCKSPVLAAVGQVDYKCQCCDGVFRY